MTPTGLKSSAQRAILEPCLLPRLLGEEDDICKLMLYTKSSTWSIMSIVAVAQSQTSETRSESVRFQTRVMETRKIVWMQLIHLESYIEGSYSINYITLILMRWPGPASAAKWKLLFKVYFRAIFKTHDLLLPGSSRDRGNKKILLPSRHKFDWIFAFMGADCLFQEHPPLVPCGLVFPCTLFTRSG